MNFGIAQAKGEEATKAIKTFDMMLNSIAVVSNRMTNSNEENGQGSLHTLSFEERVNCQRVIDEIYWRNMIWPKDNKGPKPPIEKIESYDQIKAKVEEYLKKSNALERYWQKTITGELLQAEMNR